MFALASLAASMAIIIVLVGCSGKKGASPADRAPLFLFAVDGLEWRVMQPLLDAGKLPVMAELMRRGSYGYLTTRVPTISAAIWTSVATGKAPAKHGISAFVYEEEVDGKKSFAYYTSGHRRAKALWNIASDYNLETICVGWWMTYPAEPIDGVMVSQTNTTAVLEDPKEGTWKGSLIRGVEGQVHPVERQNRVMEILAQVDDELDVILERMFGRPKYPPDDFTRLMWNHTEWSVRADETYVRVARDLVDSGCPFDILALYIGGTDVAGHRFWRYAFPEQFSFPPDPKQIEDFGHIIEDYYRYADRTIGEFLERVPGATVIVLSDHGMHATNTERVFRREDPWPLTRSGHHPDGPPGVIIASGGPFTSLGAGWDPGEGLNVEELQTIGSVLDVLPTILAIEGIPIGEDMDGQPLRSILDLEKLPAHGIQYVPTHDNPAWLSAQATRIRRAVDERERIEQLRSLGYIK
jgi:predicted AlkP superfamily pyrophosphatase or phosphodiesterase